jgi:hypothetical protein
MSRTVSKTAAPFFGFLFSFLSQVMDNERLVVIHSMKKRKKRGRKTATPKSPTSKLAIQAWEEELHDSKPESPAKELRTPFMTASFTDDSDLSSFVIVP